MSKKQKKVKKQKTLYAIFGYIVDIVIYPVILLSFFSSFFMLISKSENQVPPIFGTSFVRVLSGSMKKSDFQINDVVIVKETKATELRVGDIIAFYNYNDNADNLEMLSLYNGTTYGTNSEDVTNNISGLEKDENGNYIYNQELYNTVKNTATGETFARPSNNGTVEKLENPNRVSKDKIIDSGAKVYFHMIVNIYVDQSGTLFFETRGTSNGSSDDHYTREDLVVGKYTNTPRFVRDVVKFCASTQGMLLIVVLPLSIIVLLEMLSVLEQINNILLEKKVIKREIPFNTKETQKANVGIEMREHDKAYFYDVMPIHLKEEVFDFLWGYLKEIDNVKLQRKYITALSAVEGYEFNNSENYWNVFVESQKSNRKKAKFAKAQQQANTDKYADVINKDYQNYIDGIVPVIQQQIEPEVEKEQVEVAEQPQQHTVKDYNEILKMADELTKNSKKVEQKQEDDVSQESKAEIKKEKPKTPPKPPKKSPPKPPKKVLPKPEKKAEPKEQQKPKKPPVRPPKKPTNK